MGRTLKWAELAERIGTGAFDFEDRIAEEGRKFACSLWRNFPDFISTNNALDRSFTRGYFSRLCSDGPLPTLDPPPFTGGQCDGIFYFEPVRQNAEIRLSSLLAPSGDLTFFVRRFPFYSNPSNLAEASVRLALDPLVFV